MLVNLFRKLSVRGLAFAMAVVSVGVVEIGLEKFRSFIVIFPDNRFAF